MKSKWLSFLLMALLGPGTALAHAGKAENAAAPAQMGTKLDSTSYLPVSAHKLKSAPVLWINFDYARAHGAKVPPEGYTAEFMAQYSNQFGWVLPVKGEDSSAFENARRTMWVDLYQAYEAGKNIGSGRAAEVGPYQVKNIGKTPAVLEDGSRGHNSGVGKLLESIIDTFWTLLNQEELPYTSVPNVAILKRDTGYDPGGKVLTLLVREAPIRPAHYVPTRADSPIQSGPIEPRKFAEQLAVGLPHPKFSQATSLDDRIREGLEEYARRLGIQLATAFAHKLEHNSMGLSNFDIQGRFLDHWTQTGLPSYLKLKHLKWCDYSGDTQNTKAFMIDEFLAKVVPRLPHQIQKQQPKAEELHAIFQKVYDQTLAAEFLRHTGTPASIIQSLAGDPVVLDLGHRLVKIAREGAQEFLMGYDGKIPVGQMTKYDLGAILQNLIQLKTKDEIKLLAALPEELSDRREIAHGMSHLLNRALELSSSDGIKQRHFWRLARLQAKRRNATRQETYWGSVLSWGQKAVDSYIHSGDPQVIRAAIYDNFQANARFEDSENPYRVVLGRKRSPEQNSQITHFYDAKLGGYGYEVRLSIQKGRIWAISDSLEISHPEKLRATARILETEESLPIKIDTDPEGVTLRWQTPSRMTPVRLRLRSADKKITLIMAPKESSAGNSVFELSPPCETPLLKYGT
ncbi:MAG: hypothetical protein AB7F86_04850 [Bdellovibrionales bacterium]